MSIEDRKQRVKETYKPQFPQYVMRCECNALMQIGPNGPYCPKCDVDVRNLVEVRKHGEQ